ncbi:MAG: ABC transporter substrate-binding protein [Bacteroidaceae bacterium]|nr:ABC transporter substrate-binding protein [Bacteroidaceae bacterium]
MIKAKFYSSFFILHSSLIILSLLLFSCGQTGRQAGDVDTTAIVEDSLCQIKYAKGFQVRTLENGIRLVDIADPQTDEDRMPVSYHFALVPRTLADEQIAAQPLLSAGYTPVHVPVSRTLVMTMLQLSNFTALDALDVVRGITGTKNLFNKEVRARVKDGRIVKIGMEGNFDTELILAAQPEVIFISPFKRGGYEAIKETGITLIPHLGYKELTPLGQAEWVKFVGLFLGKEAEADSIFRGIEDRYESLKLKVNSENIKTLPTVFSGEMHGGNWYAVGGRNSLAQLFRDAGAEYIINDDNTGGVNIEFEQLYAMAADANYWRILNSFPSDFSYEALKASEPRNELFRAFREKKVIYCNMKQTPYYELSPMQPDVLLADLIAIFHPELMSEDYEPTFYRLLK